MTYYPATSMATASAMNTGIFGWISDLFDFWTTTP